MNVWLCVDDMQDKKTNVLVFLVRTKSVKVSHWPIMALWSVLLKILNNIIGDGGITVDFWIFKLHSFPLDHRMPGIIKFLWIHTFI